MNRHRIGETADGLRPERYGGTRAAEPLDDGVRDEHGAGFGEGDEARGQVDDRPEVVAVEGEPIADAYSTIVSRGTAAQEGASA